MYLIFFSNVLKSGIWLTVSLKPVNKFLKLVSVATTALQYSTKLLHWPEPIAHFNYLIKESLLVCHIKFRDDYRADLDAITQFHELSARHDELADILNSNDTSVSDFKSSETLVDEQRASSSFTYNDNRKIRSVTMSYVPDLKSESISLIRIDSVMPIGLYSGDVAAESKLEEVLKHIWLRNYESIN